MSKTQKSKKELEELATTNNIELAKQLSELREVVGETLEEKQSKRYRSFIVLLYEDSKIYDFNEVLSIIKSQKYYAYIKHLPEQDEKKEHYHVILNFDNNKSKSALSKQLGIPENYIDVVKNFRHICRYITHIDEEEKIKYNLEDVKVSKLFERKFKKQYDDIEDEQEQINKIYNFIDIVSQESNYITCLKSLIQFININVYDQVYKRYRFEFQDYLKNSCNF